MVSYAVFARSMRALSVSFRRRTAAAWGFDWRAGSVLPLKTADRKTRRYSSSFENPLLQSSQTSTTGRFAG